MRVLHVLDLYEAAAAYGLPPSAVLAAMDGLPPVQRERRGCFRVPVWSSATLDARLTDEWVREVLADDVAPRALPTRWAAEAA